MPHRSCLSNKFVKILKYKLRLKTRRQGQRELWSRIFTKKSKPPQNYGKLILNQWQMMNDACMRSLESVCFLFSIRHHLKMIHIYRGKKRIQRDKSYSHFHVAQQGCLRDRLGVIRTTTIRANLSDRPGRYILGNQEQKRQERPGGCGGPSTRRVDTAEDKATWSLR